MPLHDQNSWRPSTIAESRIGTMNRWAFLGALASRRRVDVSRGKQHASGTLALPGSWKELLPPPDSLFSVAGLACKFRPMPATLGDLIPRDENVSNEALLWRFLEYV